VGVLDGIREYMKKMPALRRGLLPGRPPRGAGLASDEIVEIVPADQTRTYEIEQVIARLVDGSSTSSSSRRAAPEVYCGLVKVDGLLVGLIANRQGFLPKGYPEYADYPGVGGKLYRQGLIKMNEFVTLCGRDRIPMLWLQDTTGIDVGDAAERAELLGLGQTLIYSIQASDLPMMLVVLRKGNAAAHYVMGGPQGNDTNAFTLGVPRPRSRSCTARPRRWRPSRGASPRSTKRARTSGRSSRR